MNFTPTKQHTDMTKTSLTDIIREAATKMETHHFAVTHKDGYANIVTSSDIAVASVLLNLSLAVVSWAKKRT